jgi:hypothetical protein
VVSWKILIFSWENVKNSMLPICCVCKFLLRSSSCSFCAVDNYAMQSDEMSWVMRLVMLTIRCCYWELRKKSCVARGPNKRTTLVFFSVVRRFNLILMNFAVLSFDPVKFPLLLRRGRHIWWLGVKIGRENTKKLSIFQ